MKVDNVKRIIRMNSLKQLHMDPICFVNLMNIIVSVKGIALLVIRLLKPVALLSSHGAEVGFC